jgi:dUTP pyrophosphatase
VARSPRPYITDKYLKVPIINQSKHPLPAYQTDGAAAFDVQANIDAPITLGSLERYAVPTGLYLAVPAGYEAQVRPRSGLAAKHGISVLNTPGTIDSDYRGELKVILVNLSKEDYVINDGDRIAQVVVAPVQQVEWEEVDGHDETARGAGGFGHTGR